MKKPRTSYLFFCSERHDAIKRENPDANFASIGKLLGKEWKGLASEEKARYMEMAEKDKERYAAELREKGEEPPSSSTSSSKKVKEANNKKDPSIKLPQSAYLFFAQDKRTQLVQQEPGMSFAECGKKLGLMWQRLDPAEAAVFHEMAERDRERYDREVGEGRQRKK